MSLVLIFFELLEFLLKQIFVRIIKMHFSLKRCFLFAVLCIFFHPDPLGSFRKLYLPKFLERLNLFSYSLGITLKFCPLYLFVLLFNILYSVFNEHIRSFELRLTFVR